MVYRCRGGSQPGRRTAPRLATSGAAGCNFLNVAAAVGDKVANAVRLARHPQRPTKHVIDDDPAGASGFQHCLGIRTGEGPAGDIETHDTTATGHAGASVAAGVGNAEEEPVFGTRAIGVVDFGERPAVTPGAAV